jgi:hypothetical protein
MSPKETYSPSTLGDVLVHRSTIVARYSSVLPDHS